MKRQGIKQVGLYALWALLLLSCGSGGLIRNPDVDRWCGDNPCDWQVEGEIKRVGTWHPNDYAVSLVSDDAALIQENATINNTASDCLSFTMIAKIAAGVKVFLELDFLADGSVEFSQRLPESDWERRTFKITAPDWYSKVRFIIRKEGPGRAILAELAAENANRTCTAPPVELLDRPEGAACSSDEQCAGGVACTTGRCNGCVDDSSCAQDELCAIKDVADQRYKACVGMATTPLGAACDYDAQCATGVCSDGACSECATDEDCDFGRRCNVAQNRPPAARFWPRLCGAGEGKREKEESCTHNLDCQSYKCADFEASCTGGFCSDVRLPCGTCGPEIQLGACR